MPLFTLKNVRFRDIIQYPDIEITADKTTFICGESGSGKSTLLKMLNGVISPTEGLITCNGRNIEECETIMLRRENLLVGQSVYLFDRSIKENFDQYYAYRGLEPVSEQTVESYLEICAVKLPLNSMCGVLSGGERHRIFIAVNLSYQPKVLMIDEPTSALDDKNANALMRNLKSHCKASGITLIVVSHDREIAGQYADEIITLGGGENGRGSNHLS